MSSEHEFGINMSDDQRVRGLCTRLRVLKGEWKFHLKQDRGTRSQKQNRYLFGEVVEALVLYQREQGENWSKDQCFYALKLMFLPTREIANPRTGELITVAAESHKTDTAEFFAFVEDCRNFLAQMGVTTNDPEPKWWANKQETAA